MGITELSEYLSELFGIKVWALNFPEFSKEKNATVKLEITSGVAEVGGVADFNIQLMSKGIHPSNAEAVCLDMIKKLGNKTNKIIAGGKYQLILAQAEAPQPFYMGQTEDGAFLMSINFRLLTTKLV